MSDWPDKPAPGDRVMVNDPWGPAGPATVVEVQVTPHHAVLVRMDDGTNTDQPKKQDPWHPPTTRVREQWVLGPHVKPITKEDTND